MNYPDKFEKVFHLVPEYGRFDDLLTLFPKYLDNETIISLTTRKSSIMPVIQDQIVIDKYINIQQSIIELYSNQLRKDKELMEDGKPISICAKWMPSEGDSKDKKYKLVDTLSFNMDVSPREYRKEYITPLRTYLNIVEKFMCSRRWDEIEYSKVPSCAIKKLKKAFEKHSPEQFKAWKESLSKGEVKVNAKQLFPHELVKEMRTTGKCDEVCKAQWKVLEEEVRKLGTLSKALVVVDTSGSMTSNNNLPLDIATGMGLLVSNVVEGEFHGNVITFHSNPKFVQLTHPDIFTRYQKMLGMEWGGSTNIQATFDMILEKGRKANLKPEDMPETIFIISDMQFNSCTTGVSKTNFQVIEEKYRKYDYKRPRIVFWNVNGSSTDFPVTVDDNDTCLVSGASPSILKSIINCKEFSSIRYYAYRT